MKYLIFFFAIIMAGWSNYDGLTPREKAIVKEALEKAMYYEFYRSLKDGTDRIEVTDIEKVSENRISDSLVENTYRIKVDFYVNGVCFKRIMIQKITMEVKIKQPTFWETLKDYTWKIGLGIIIGGVAVAII